MDERIMEAIREALEHAGIVLPPLPSVTVTCTFGSVAVSKKVFSPATGGLTPYHGWIEESVALLKSGAHCSVKLKFFHQGVFPPDGEYLVIKWTPMLAPMPAPVPLVSYSIVNHENIAAVICKTPSGGCDTLGARATMARVLHELSPNTGESDTLHYNAS